MLEPNERLGEITCRLCDYTVSCLCNRLYNKESVLMALLDKSNLPQIISHIRSLRVTTCTLELLCVVFAKGL